MQCFDFYLPYPFTSNLEGFADLFECLLLRVPLMKNELLSFRELKQASFEQMKIFLQ